MQIISLIRIQAMKKICKTNSPILIQPVVEYYINSNDRVSCHPVAMSCFVVGLDRLTNVQPGQFYGPASTWSAKKRRLLGVHLITKAFKILLADGERQIRPMDLK